MKRGIITLLLILIPSVASAQASINVQVGDPVEGLVYRAIDRLVAAGVVDDIIVGQRPYSRLEIARILTEAEKNFDRLTKPTDKMMVFRILKYWGKKYHREMSLLVPDPKGDKWKTVWHPFERLDIMYDYLHGQDRAIFDNGMGTVNGHIRPLTENRDGRQYVQGHNFAFETYHWMQGSIFALYAHPRFMFQIDGGEDNAEVHVQELYGKVGYRNLELEIGRDHVIFGQGEYGGLILSNNARGLDMVKVSTPYPVALPYIDNLKFTGLLANMGPDYRFKYAYLGGGKLSFEPVRYLEFGFNYNIIFGGEFAPASTDQFFGPDLRLRIPPLMSTELYFEYYLQRNSSTNSIANKSSYLGGIYLPRLGRANNMAIRLEYKHTGKAAYRHNVFTSGLGLSGEIMGDPLGPDGDGGYFTYYYDLGLASLLQLDFAYERRGGDIFGAAVTKRPAESRYRTSLSLDVPIVKIIRTKWEFGYERTDNFNFTSGNDRNSLWGGLTLSINWNIR